MDEIRVGTVLVSPDGTRRYVISVDDKKVWYLYYQRLAKGVNSRTLRDLLNVLELERRQAEET